MSNSELAGRNVVLWVMEGGMISLVRGLRCATKN